MDEYILDGETGYLVPEETPEVYAKYALILLQMKKLEWSKAKTICNKQF